MEVDGLETQRHRIKEVVRKIKAKRALQRYVSPKTRIALTTAADARAREGKASYELKTVEQVLERIMAEVNHRTSIGESNATVELPPSFDKTDDRRRKIEEALWELDYRVLKSMHNFKIKIAWD